MEVQELKKMASCIPLYIPIRRAILAHNFNVSTFNMSNLSK